MVKGGRVTDTTAKPTADTGKHICMSINTLVHDNRRTPTERRQDVETILCVIKAQMSSGLVADNVPKHVILRVCVWNALSKVNKDLRPLKPILICWS